MNITIDTSLFAPPVLQSVKIIAIFNYGSDGHHRIFISDDQNKDYLSWKNAQNTSLQDEFKHIISQSQLLETFQPARYSIIIHSGKTDWQSIPPKLNLADAENEIIKPFIVCLEDNISDRDFLLAMANANQRRKLEDFEKNNILLFHSGGGINGMERSCSAKLSPSQQFVRAWLMVDHDGLHPSTPSDQSKRVEKFCKDYNIPWHRLKRRCRENYLPEEILKKHVIDYNMATFNAFIKLNIDQRHFYNMAKGFKGDQNRKNKGENDDGLNSNLTPNELDQLGDGFNNSVKSLKFEDIDEQHLKNDGEWDEINPLVTQLIAMIR